jgi:hypothetical protein
MVPVKARVKRWSYRYVTVEDDTKMTQRFTNDTRMLKLLFNITPSHKLQGVYVRREYSAYSCPSDARRWSGGLWQICLQDWGCEELRIPEESRQLKEIPVLGASLSHTREYWDRFWAILLRESPSKNWIRLMRHPTWNRIHGFDD